MVEHVEKGEIKFRFQLFANRYLSKELFLRGSYVVHKCLKKLATFVTH